PRWPTRGEASGVVLRALRLGRPTIVSDVGWFAELPDGAVRRVAGPGPVGAPDLEVAALEEVLFELRDRPDERARLAAGPRAYAAASSWPAAGRRGAEILAGVAAPRARAP